MMSAEAPWHPPLMAQMTENDTLDCHRGGGDRPRPRSAVTSPSQYIPSRAAQHLAATTPSATSIELTQGDRAMPFLMPPELTEFPDQVPCCQTSGRELPRMDTHHTALSGKVDLIARYRNDVAAAALPSHSRTLPSSCGYKVVCLPSKAPSVLLVTVDLLGNAW
jgi:hypothetical protein